MKTLTKENLSLYLFEDGQTVDLADDSTVVGNPAEFIIGDCNSSDSVLHESVTPPKDWVGGKYLFDGTTWELNPDYVEPEPEPVDTSFRNVMRVYRRAFRLALQQTPYGETNILVAIEAHVATLDPYNSVRMAWEDVTIFERTHPDMSMFSELGLTDEQIDDIFRLAQSLEAGA